jgi:hypothetical protein
LIVLNLPDNSHAYLTTPGALEAIGY